MNLRKEKYKIGNYSKIRFAIFMKVLAKLNTVLKYLLKNLVRIVNKMCSINKFFMERFCFKFVDFRTKQFLFGMYFASSVSGL